MTYYFINDKGQMQKQIGGVPPEDGNFIGVTPNGIMKKYEDGKVVSVAPIPNLPARDTIEWENAKILLGINNTMRKHNRSKIKSKRKKCSCKK